MKVLAIIALVVCMALAVDAAYVTERQYQREFSKFVKTFGKKYTTDDFFNRFEQFKQNLDLIELHNSQNGQTSTMGVNQFADLSSNEMAARMNGFQAGLKKANKVATFTQAQMDLAADPAPKNWNDVGAVTPIKDQGQCGSCWSFSATGSIEGAVFLKSKKLVSLSEQQLMDCSVPEGDQSCEGGLMDDAFQFVIDNKGICAEADYPYVAKDETCKKTCKVVSHISDFVDVPTDPTNPNNETGLMAAAMLGPVSVAIEADQPVFQLYTGGVITSAACGTALDHGVLIVGWGTDNTTNVDYWIVKNSWGASWGEKGFVRLARNQNECGINSMSSYPIAA